MLDSSGVEEPKRREEKWFAISRWPQVLLALTPTQFHSARCQNFKTSRNVSFHTGSLSSSITPVAQTQVEQGRARSEPSKPEGRE
ncbi:hypothetical protein PoB_000267800 [Plakobranchus ocellatus]|uniref:Uncharacterized protein n=1 Tax=Plakobranchus ocellatus TaxID=259542 RepID=A0AAV3Y0J6_9GAST|nr:hypothetical protein PoB_000267800 [Plakobranchus ocellatus]